MDKQAGEAAAGRYEIAPPIRRDGAGRGAYRFFLMRWGRGRFVSPVPRLFFLSCLVALDRAVGIPAHRSEIQAEGQDGHGTRGKANTHEGRSK